MVQLLLWLPPVYCLLLLGPELRYLRLDFLCFQILLTRGNGDSAFIRSSIDFS